MRSDSKRDGIKREHVIFTQACLRSRQRRANYICLCECFCRSNLELGEGEGRFEKNVRTSGKILATPLKLASVWDSKDDIAVRGLADTYVHGEGYFDGQWSGFLKETRRNQGNSEKNSICCVACGECYLVSGWFSSPVDVGRMCFQPSRSHCLLVNQTLL